MKIKILIDINYLEYYLIKNTDLEFLIMNVLTSILNSTSINATECDSKQGKFKSPYKKHSLAC